MALFCQLTGGLVYLNRRKQTHDLSDSISSQNSEDIQNVFIDPYWTILILRMFTYIPHFNTYDLHAIGAD